MTALPRITFETRIALSDDYTLTVEKIVAKAAANGLSPDFEQGLEAALMEANKNPDGPKALADITLEAETIRYLRRMGFNVEDAAYAAPPEKIAADARQNRRILITHRKAFTVFSRTPIKEIPPTIILPMEQNVRSTPETSPVLKAALDHISSEAPVVLRQWAANALHYKTDGRLLGFSAPPRGSPKPYKIHETRFMPAPGKSA